MDYHTRFQDYLRDRKSALTMKNYLATYDQYYIFLKGREPDESNVEEFLVYKSHRGCCPRALNRHLAALKSFFKHVLRKELIIESYRFDKKLPEWLDEDEQRKYLAACDTPLEKALVAVLLNGGLRVSEIAGLLIENVDLEGYLKVMGKGGKERVVAVEPQVIDAINEYLNNRTIYSPKVFPRGVRAIQEIIKNIGERAKISKKITPHLLRHSMGSLFMDKGGDIVQLQHLLGHANIATTGIYTHTKPSRIQEKMPKRMIRLLR